MTMRIDSLRRARLVLGFAVCAALACGGAERPPVETVPTRRAVHEAFEELPGVVLGERHFALAGALHVTVATPDEARTRAALASAFAVADSIDRMVSHHVAGSDVSRINAAAGREPVAVSPWLEEIIALGLEWAERTGGAFDPTVGPLVDAWGFGETVTVPTNEKLEAARRLVGWSKVRLDRSRHTVFLPEAGMQLDLRALAKGYALDRMRETMIAAGATSGIADFDGDLMFFGPGTESRADLWPIEVPDPYDPNRTFARLELFPGGFSTSAYYDRAIEIEGERYGHLLDPRTGWPVRGLASVSVYATDVVINDILATALFVMGTEEGLRFAEELDDVEAMFVVDAEPGQRSKVVTTGGLGRYLKDVDPPYRPAVVEDR